MQWISTADRLPDPFSTVILAMHRLDQKGLEVTAGIYLGGDQWRVNGSYKVKNPPFWMPMPEAPEVANE